MPKVSVIIPVYNIEKYVEVCIKSLIFQTLTDIEIILINDGSSDSSHDICQKYAALDNRIVYIKKDNGGVSSARNAGLDVAKGDYIMFLDGDDFIEKEAIETLLNLAESNDVDAVMFEYNIDDNKNSVTHNVADARYNKVIDAKSAIEITISPKNRFAWSKLYKKDIIGNLKFDEGIYRGEDTWFAINALNNAKKVYYTDYAPYHYIQSDNSAVRCEFNNKKLSVVTVYEYMIKFSKENYPAIVPTALDAYIGESIAVVYDMHISGVDRKDIKKLIKRIAQNINFKDLKVIGKSNALQYLLCRFCPEVLYIIKNRTHK